MIAWIRQLFYFLCHPAQRDKARLLKKTHFFTQLTREEWIKFYESAADIITFPNQHILFLAGDAPDYVYLILSGTVTITLLKNNLAEAEVQLGLGQIFGELGVLNNQPRKGTATATSTLQVLRIPIDVFTELFANLPHLRSALTARQSLYQIPQRGKVTITDDVILGMPALKIEFVRPDGEKISATRALEDHIFTIEKHFNLPTETVVFQKNNLQREIKYHNKKIIALVSIGDWDELGNVCGLLLDGISLADSQIEAFAKTGSLIGETATEKNEDKICYCMSVTRSTILDCIQQGMTLFAEISEKTGAGRVCGSCRPKINDMLKATSHASS